MNISAALIRYLVLQLACYSVLRKKIKYGIGEVRLGHEYNLGIKILLT